MYVYRTKICDDLSGFALLHHGNTANIGQPSRGETKAGPDSPLLVFGGQESANFDPKILWSVTN